MQLKENWTRRVGIHFVMNVFVTLLTLSGCLAQSFYLEEHSTFENSCQNEYTQCLASLVDRETGKECRSFVSFMQCLTAATQRCFPGFAAILRGYSDFVQEGCRPGATIARDSLTLFNCISKHNDELGNCLTANNLEVASDVCSLFIEYTECYATEIRQVCGRQGGKTYRKLLKPVVDSALSCKNSPEMQGYTLSQCEQAFLECNLKALFDGSFSCTEYAKCYVEILRNCNENEHERIAALEERLEQIPELCDPNSKIRKSLSKSWQCIWEKMNTLSCKAEMTDALKALQEEDKTARERTAESAKIQMKVIDCTARQLGSICNEEAEFSVRYMSRPMEKRLNRICMEHTKENCLGYSSGNAGLKLSFFVFFFNTVYAFALRNL